MVLRLEPVKATEVKDAVSLSNWASAAYGVPPPTKGDFMTLNKKARDLFNTCPGTDWQTLVEVVKWCHQRKYRFGRIWKYVDQYRHAWAAGVIELDHEQPLDVAVKNALVVEKDPAWRSRLRRCVGECREEVLEEWKVHRASTT